MPTPIDPAALRQKADRAVGEVLRKMQGHAEAADRAAAKLEGGAISKAAGSGGVAAALLAARAGEDRPPSYWRGALRQLGETLKPDGSPHEQRQAALASSDGRLLVAPWLATAGHSCRHEPVRRPSSGRPRARQWARGAAAGWRRTAAGDAEASRG
jgi:hypothetical protein